MTKEKAKEIVNGLRGDFRKAWEKPLVDAYGEPNNPKFWTDFVAPVKRHGEIFLKVMTDTTDDAKFAFGAMKQLGAFEDLVRRVEEKNFVEDVRLSKRGDRFTYTLYC